MRKLKLLIVAVLTLCFAMPAIAQPGGLRSSKFGGRKINKKGLTTSQLRSSKSSLLNKLTKLKSIKVLDPIVKLTTYDRNSAAGKKVQECRKKLKDLKEDKAEKYSSCIETKSNELQNIASGYDWEIYISELGCGSASDRIKCAEEKIKEQCLDQVKSYNSQIDEQAKKCQKLHKDYTADCLGKRVKRNNAKQARDEAGKKVADLEKQLEEAKKKLNAANLKWIRSSSAYSNLCSEKSGNAKVLKKFSKKRR